MNIGTIKKKLLDKFCVLNCCEEAREACGRKPILCDDLKEVELDIDELIEEARDSGRFSMRNNY